MAVTIKDIAKKTGLGNATISAYLNGVPVRPYNKIKIEAAIEELGYIRNDYARGLKTHSSRTIGVLIPELSNIFSTTIISEMEEKLQQKGYGIIVCDCRTDLKREQNALKFLLSKMVDGLIIMPISTSGEALNIAIANKIPTVVIDRLTDCDKVSHVVINNREISRTATNKILDKGCKKVVCISGCEDVYTAFERREGYKEALTECGASQLPLIYDGNLTVQGGYDATKKAFAENQGVDGIFVTNYEMSMGSIIALKEMGYSMGVDVQFVGFDNIEMSKAFNPVLSTVNQPLKQIGVTAAETILDMIDGGEVKNIILPAEIIG